MKYIYIFASFLCLPFFSFLPFFTSPFCTRLLLIIWVVLFHFHFIIPVLCSPIFQRSFFKMSIFPQISSTGAFFWFIASFTHSHSHFFLSLVSCIHVPAHFSTFFVSPCHGLLILLGLTSLLISPFRAASRSSFFSFYSLSSPFHSFSIKQLMLWEKCILYAEF